MRPLLVLFHRYVGLVMAGFLVIAGLTGSLLAWNDELEATLAPGLFRVEPPSVDTPPLDPLALRERVQAAHRNIFVGHAPLDHEPGRSMVFYLSALPGEPGPANDQLFVNPYTGEILGARKWGDISQGLKNLMPFVYRLHYSLAMGETGTLIFGIVALLWTCDCFVGAYLTFPPNRKNFWRQWRKAWRLRMNGGAYKLNFDLHRAGGLWLWAMLFVLAWSSVSFNLRGEVFDPVMKTLFAHQARVAAEPLARPLPDPPVGWMEARDRGRALIGSAARDSGFVIERETALSYDPTSGVWFYNVHSSRDVGDDWGMTRVAFSAIDGRLLEMWMPTGAAAGDSIRTWIIALHMAATWGRPFDLFMTAMGLVVAMLATTGLVIWWRKRGPRTARRRTARRGREPCGPAGEVHAAE